MLINHTWLNHISPSPPSPGHESHSDDNWPWSCLQVCKSIWVKWPAECWTQRGGNQEPSNNDKKKTSCLDTEAHLGANQGYYKHGQPQRNSALCIGCESFVCEFARRAPSPGSWKLLYNFLVQVSLYSDYKMDTARRQVSSLSRNRVFNNDSSSGWTHLKASDSNDHSRVPNMASVKHGEPLGP